MQYLYKLGYNKDQVRRSKRDHHLKKIFGISIEDQDNMMEDQNGQCKICDKILDIPCIDHCHLTGVIRGLLCRTCNLGIGHLNDDPKLLRKAITYLEKPNDYREPKRIRGI